jgi:hypothetical protein
VSAEALKASVRVAVLAGLLVLLSGCLGPVSLHHAVLGYDRTVAQIEQEMLLLNIARLRHRHPLHFTVTSSIAATFDYRTSIAAGGVYNATPGLFAPTFTLGAMAAENPTLSIVPIQGREFTERVLTPVQEGVFEFFVFQGAPIDMVMRLLVDGIEVQTAEGRFERFILNWPTRPTEYEEFRRIALHLAWLNANRKLFVGRLSFTETVRAGLRGPPPADEIRTAMEKDYRWRQVPGTDLYELGRRVTGRVVITNYDPRGMTDAARAELNTLASGNPASFVLIDIRSEHPGGDWPLFGALKLRSFNRILEFVAEGGSGVTEFDVAKDSRTGPVESNPSRTLAIEITGSAPSAEAPHTRYREQYYTVADTAWDRAAFRLLYQGFQMTVTDVSKVGLPITISK